MINNQFQIYSDASLQNNKAGVAFIIQNQNSINKRCGLIYPYDTFTLELLAGLIPILYLSEAHNNSLSIEWFTDCQTIEKQFNDLNSPKKIENQQTNHLWQVLKNIKTKCLLRVFYQERTNKNIQNCDKASKWMSAKGEQILQQYGEAHIGRNKIYNKELAWKIIDFREINFSMNKENKSINETVTAQIFKKIE